jgi:dipeptide/tripeptide permease
MRSSSSRCGGLMNLTCMGSGGIKPCVSSFGGDQFRESSARER